MTLLHSANGDLAHGSPRKMDMRVIAAIIATLCLLSDSAGSENKVVAGETAEVSVKFQDLRLYRVNKDGIESRFWFTRGKSKRTGCHNLRKRSRLYRAVQYGYQSCEVYKNKGCEVQSKVMFNRKDNDEPTSILQQGYSWFAIDEDQRGPRIKSWSCTHQD